MLLTLTGRSVGSVPMAECLFSLGALVACLTTFPSGAKCSVFSATSSVQLSYKRIPAVVWKRKVRNQHWCCSSSDLLTVNNDQEHLRVTPASRRTSAITLTFPLIARFIHPPSDTQTPEDERLGLQTELDFILFLFCFCSLLWFS